MRTRVVLRVVLLHGVLAVALKALAAPAPETGGPMAIELPAAVWTDRSTVHLGDIANIRTSDLGLLKRALSVRVHGFPRGGSVARLTSAELEALLAQATSLRREDLVWTGAHSVTLHPSLEQISGPVAAHEALREIHTELQSRATHATATLRSVPADWTPPSGAVALHVRELDRQLTASGARVVWIDAHVDKQFVRRLPVGISIEGVVGQGMPQEAWLAPVAGLSRRPLAMQLSPAPRPLAQEAPKWSSSEVALSSPTPVRPPHSGAAVTRGSAVRLLVRGGGVEIETQAESLQGGGIGDVIRVRPRKSGDTLLARVVAQGAVEVMHGD